jgi:hypothetical protein
VARPERSSFDTALRFELASEEDRPLFVSYLVATVLATTWLVLVHAIPSPLSKAILMAEPPVITFVPPPFTAAEPRIDRNAGGRRGARESSRESFRKAFSGNTGLVDAGKILRGVDLAPTGSTTGEPATRAVGLETGRGSLTPGRTGTPGLSPGGNGLGTVRGGGISRNAVTIAPPEVRAVAGAPTGITSELGQTVRAHAPQLERCYHQEGLSRNPALAGLVRLSLTVEGGRVTSAQVVDRTWTGAGAAEVESCLVRMARGWRLGTSDAQIVVPLSFTSPR